MYDFNIMVTIFTDIKLCMITGKETEKEDLKLTIEMKGIKIRIKVLLDGIR